LHDHEVVVTERSRQGPLLDFWLLDARAVSPYKGGGRLQGDEDQDMQGNTVTRFFGGSPGRVLIQLVAISFVVGIVLNVLGVSPFDIINGLERLARRIYEMGFDTVEWIFRYFLLGAVVVFPIWLISRLVRIGRREDRSPQA
jgi:hypothetical protein